MDDHRDEPLCRKRLGCAGTLCPVSPLPFVYVAKERALRVTRRHAITPPTCADSTKFALFHTRGGTSSGTVDTWPPGSTYDRSQTNFSDASHMKHNLYVSVSTSPAARTLSLSSCTATGIVQKRETIDENRKLGITLCSMYVSSWFFSDYVRLS